MRVVIALFVVCAIAAACGKKINPVITSELDLAILREDGGIYEDRSVRKFELHPDTGESTPKAPAAATYDYNVHLRESRFKTRTESEVAIDLFEANSERALMGRLIFKLMGKPISEYGTFRETCTLADDPSPLSTCRIQSVILRQEETDPLGNKKLVFKHSSENFTRDHQGVSYCEITLDASHVAYREAAYAGNADGTASGETYKYAVLTSQAATDVQAPAALTVTCYKNITKERGKTPEYRSVFRGVFRQSRVN
jgi:hypothetical protein